MPVFGICFGNQILGRALGFGTYKLKYGHRGINQPVQDRATGRVEISAHNHGFAVDAPLDGPSDTPFGRAEVSHVCLNDDVVEGLRLLDAPCVQRPVPPGGGGRAARLRLPVRPVRRDDAGRALMPRRADLSSVLVIGSGPIVIGQAAEFDYSGTQACRVLRAEGLRVILVNSNPATIMTDPEFADATYVEPITPEIIEKIIAKERPDALLPTLGWADRAERGDRAARERCPREVRRRADRRRRRRHPAWREPRALQGHRRGDRRRGRSLGDLPHDGRVPGGRRRPRLPGGGAAVVHDGWRRFGNGIRRGTTCTASPAPGSGGQPHDRGAARGVDHRLEGVRARADARQERQRRGDLLDREPRPDGRAHRATRSRSHRR